MLSIQAEATWTTRTAREVCSANADGRSRRRSGPLQPVRGPRLGVQALPHGMALDSRFTVLSFSNDDGSCRDGRRGTMPNFWAPENAVITYAFVDRS